MRPNSNQFNPLSQAHWHCKQHQDYPPKSDHCTQIFAMFSKSIKIQIQSFSQFNYSNQSNQFNPSNHFNKFIYFEPFKRLNQSNLSNQSNRSNPFQPNNNSHFIPYIHYSYKSHYLQIPKGASIWTFSHLCRAMLVNMT